MPRALVAYQQSGNCYDGPQFTPVKAAIRTSLLAEQGYLCAYCMQRIDSNRMRVEHWRSQASHPELQLDYANMLGCCDGNSSQGHPAHTCDTRKGNTPIKFNPANAPHHARLAISYLANGRIKSSDGDWEANLNIELNLNSPRLVNNRKEVVKGVISVLSSRDGNRTIAEIQRLYDSYRIVDRNGKLKEFLGVVEYYLRKKGAR